MDPTEFRLAAEVLERRTRHALRAAGHPDFPPSYEPYVVHVLQGVASPGDLARRIKVTQQYVSKVVKDLVAHGYLMQSHFAADRRQRLLSVTTRASDAIEVCGQVRADIRDEIARAQQFSTWLRDQERELVS